MLKITIITVVKDSHSTIEECIKCVNEQTYKVIEHIIIDGGSKDGTLEIVHKIKKRNGIIITEPDEGMYDAVNKGISLAEGDIIGILNSDDFYANDKVLKKVCRVLQRYKVDSCYADLVYVDHKNKDKIIRHWKSGKFNNKKFHWGWMPPHPTFFVRRRIYEKYGKFNLELGTAADYELMLRFLVKHNISTAYLPKVLVKMRTGGVSNVSLRNRLKANYNDRLAGKLTV